MALTRKMLQAMDIPAEKIDEIINAHTETVTALKDERDKVQKEYDELKDQNKGNGDIQKKLDEANEELEKLKGADWEQKYKDLKSEYDTYKNDVDAKAVKAKKESAYKKLLEDAGVPAKRLDSIMKISTSAVDGIKFDKDGNVTDADDLKKAIQTEWADFIPETHEKGADVSTPPAGGNTEVKKPSKAAEMVAQYRNEHYGNPMKED